MDLKHFLHELKRMRWMIAIPIVVIFARSYGFLSDTSPLTLVLYKPALACIGAMAGHIFWSQCFYYIDFAELVKHRNGVGLELVAFSILRAGIYAAFILGVTLGL